MMMLFKIKSLHLNYN